ncbi:MAG: FAD-dependent oxidoreductase [Candidatus Methylacidiphilales bacterium]
MILSSTPAGSDSSTPTDSDKSRSGSTVPKTYMLQRSVPIEEGYDIVVAGGGPGGCGAAIAAGRRGEKVLLLEATGCLGGMGTSAMVSAWSDLADGERMLAGGLMGEIVETMYERGYYKPGIDPIHWRQKLHSGFGYNTEGLKLLLDELCLAAHVELRFFTRVIDVEVNAGTKKVQGVVLHNIEGYRFVKARTFIDATGDAVLSALCGAAYRQAGRDTEHIMAPTLCAAQAGIDTDRFNYGHQQNAVFQGIKDGFFTQPDRHVPGLFITGRTTAIMNAGHLFGTDAVNCRSLSDGMVRGRKFADEYTRFFRKYLGGCEEISLVATASLLGIRESRRIVGECELKYDDMVARRSFPDQIAVYNKPVDVHVHDCSDEQWERYKSEFLTKDRLAKGEFYGLPYGILVPEGWDNLWVAGRCNSSDVQAHGAIRDQPACFMMGEAAGTAAVQSIRTGQPACDLDTAELVTTLREAGAYLPQRELSRQMTRKTGSLQPVA